MSGFYGNITDTSQKIFQFDRIFPNRKAMDDAAADGTDGIFIGHFVLVKYNDSGNYVLLNNSDNDYLANYNIDKNAYNQQEFDIRGYDATVWQKVYSNGKGKFISVATLNGLMPTIDLEAKAPVSLPAQAQISPQSEYGYYKLDVPTHWGFRIKEALSSNESDEKATQIYEIYDNEGNKTGVTEREINADIYYNKDGLNRQIQSSSNKSNYILLSPSGHSGKLYNGEPSADIQELSISLPVIGNAISNFYDNIYEVDENLQRKLDTKWYDGNDARRIDGDSTLNGKSYNLDTAAGVINTFHDRLGQIIVPLNSFPILDREFNALEDGYIYSYEGKYYYKIKDDIYTAINEINNNDISYTADASVTALNYEVNTYYIENNGNYVIADLAFDQYPEGTVFYRKNISALKYNPIELTNYQPNQFYYLDIYNNYLLDGGTSPANINWVYYTINSQNIVGPKTFTDQYYPGSYFINEGTHYRVSYDTTPDIENNTYYAVENTSLGFNKIIYQPGKYYYYTRDENQNLKPELATGNFNSIENYFYIPLSQTPVPVYVNGETYLGYLLDEENKVEVNLSDPIIAEGQQIYIYDTLTSSYIPYEEDTRLTTQKEYFVLNATEISSFFFPNVYYTYETRDGQIGYYLAQQFQSQTTQYYELTGISPITAPFYESNKYYYYNGTSYLKDINNSMTENRIYYAETPLCVFSDSSGRYPKGYEWNEYALFVPASVILATKEKKNTLIEISGIDNGDGSIHGTLLNFNKIAAFKNTNTRDKNTIQGTLNLLQDKLYNITNLQPQHLLWVNNFGQITSNSTITEKTITDLIAAVADLQTRVTALE